MMKEIENAVRWGKNICSEAPNGFGKTCVALCGTLPWVHKNRGKVLYCARTHRQLDRVMEELTSISRLKKVSGVSFRGRRHMCLNKFVIDNAGSVAPISEVCGQLKSTGRCPYYEKLRSLAGSYHILEDMPSRVLKAPEIVKVGKDDGICPYELAKLLIKEVDVVALSYLYIFDPFIFESFSPELDTPMSRIILIQDEAHNVPSSAMESASDSLTLGTIRQAMREATTYNDSISRLFCRGLAKCVLDLSTGMKDNEERVIDPQEAYNQALNLSELDTEIQPLSYMRSMGNRIRRGLLKAGKFPRSVIYRVAEFMLHWLRVIGRDDYEFILSSKRFQKRNRRFALDLVSLDPTSITNPILKLIHSSVAISGTISPLDAYSEMLGFEHDAIKKEFSNPFAQKNRLGIIVKGIDTSYERRSVKMYKLMVDYCAAVAHATPNNTGVFTTSYGIARSLLKAGLEKKLQKKLYLEEQGMSTSDNDSMIERFKKKGEKEGAVLLGVQGGRNSEGGDFPGSTMESVIVVGVPYARPTPRNKALIDYFDKRFNGKGRDYAYVLPAMTRAIQTAGRPVRKMDDKGAIILLDQRFSAPYLKRFMPV
ncbi:MAG: helicase C-terminal domain-containing protein, partial [Candidatus Thorarchaeota archaeon]